MTTNHHHHRRQDKMRLVQWFAAAAFSTIALVALTSNLEGQLRDETSEVRWAVAAVSITVTCAALAVLASLLLQGASFVGTALEGGLVRARAGENPLSSFRPTPVEVDD